MDFVSFFYWLFTERIKKKNAVCTSVFLVFFYENFSMFLLIMLQNYGLVFVLFVSIISIGEKIFIDDYTN